jgi:hypothetical protein
MVTAKGAVVTRKGSKVELLTTNPLYSYSLFARSFDQFLIAILKNDLNGVVVAMLTANPKVPGSNPR